MASFTRGDYGDENSIPRRINDDQLSRLIAASDEIFLGQDGTFVVCEYGSANGINSFEVLHSMLDNLKERNNAPQECMIIYQDLPGNNFNALFETVKERKRNLSTAKEKLNDKITYLATASNFYEKCLPPGMLHLGFSVGSMHWLSKVPCPTADFPHTWTDDEVAKAYRAQAARDWKQILMMRDRELVEGGQLVLSMNGMNASGECMGITRNTRNIWVILRDIFREMKDEGKVTQDELVNTVKHFYARTEDEIKFPFQQTGTGPEHSLRLEDIEMKTYRCPFNAKWKDDPRLSRSQIEESASKYIQSFRCWNEHAWYNGLSTARRESERMEIVDELYSRYYRQVIQNPSEHGMDIVICSVRISKMKSCSQ